MECSCDIDVCIDSNIKIDFHNKDHVIAIIDHKCCECSRTIKEGEDYELVFGSWDGYKVILHTCSDCLNIRNIFFPYGYYFESLWYELTESLGDWDYQVPEDCMVKLTKRNFNKICAIIEEGWEHLENMES